MNPYPFHPAAVLFPMMPEGRLAELVEDVRRNGLIKPIEVYEEQIIDGRNRLEACKRAGIEPHYKDVTADVDDPVAYAASVNLKRRDLTIDQRAAIIAELATLSKGSNQYRRQNEGPSNGGPSLTAREAAKVAGVSISSVERAKKRMREDPEAHEAAKAGRQLQAPCLQSSKSTAVRTKAKPNSANRKSKVIALPSRKPFARDLDEMVLHDDQEVARAIVDRLGYERAIVVAHRVIELTRGGTNCAASVKTVSARLDT